MSQETIGRRACSLRERLARPLSEPTVDREKADKRLARWRQQEPLDEDELFAARLEVDNLDTERFLNLLGETIDEVAETSPEARSATSPRFDRGTLDWLERFHRCYPATTTGANPTEPSTRLRPPTRWRRTSNLAFWPLVEPLARDVLGELMEQVRSLTVPLDHGSLATLLTECLPIEMINWPIRTLVLELNIARLRNELSEQDPQARFLEFAKRFRDPAHARVLFDEYPVLARQLVELLERWKEATFETLERLCNDWADVITTLPELKADDTLADLRLGAGDRHDGGRTVAILRFSSGARLVYKPRPLSLDRKFQNLLATLDEWGDHPPFYQLRLLDRGHYGWVEFIDASPCEDEAQIRRFYLRQGGYLAILYILRANDIHFENLIAIGEHPVIIDLEAILQPGPPREDSAEPDPLQDSIIRVGLLPVRTWQNESSPGLDVSALGGAAGQMSPRPEASWAKSGTDHMRYARKTRALPLPARHRPALDGTAQPALRYLDEIKTGFETLYRLFLTHRAELLADDGPLTAFKGEDIRVLLRPTNLYAIVLRDSFHPQFLGDALERDLFFDKLWRQVPRHPHLRQVIGAEQHALHQRDIPLFRAHSDSRTVRSTTGETWPDFFTASGMSLVRDRIEELGEKDLRTQLWFIEASMAILSDDERERPTPRTAQRQTTTPLGETEPVSTDRLIELASTIGEALATNCLEERESIRWLGLQPTMAGAYQIALSGTGLYSGQPGITLFLAYLAALSDHDRLRAVAELSCATLLDDVRHDTPADIRKIGAFDGLTGLLFTFVHLASLWQRSDLLEHALDLCARIDPWIDDDQRFDVVHGAAGTILALAAIHDMRPRPAILETMVRCGDHLLAHARHDENGASWLTSPEATVPLAGFAHGTAGIATALVELAARVDEGRFLEVAHQALRYERGLFSPEHGNWPDLRTDAKQPHDLYYWCHGAPGIGLGRTLVLRHEDNAECREDLELALRATTAHGFGLNHSLCHGDLGNLDILRVAATTTHADWLHEIIDTQATRLATEISEYGWRCGLPMEVESPGLMVGLAGVGYGLLRLAEPRRVPSLLALEPPRGPSPTLNEQKTLD